MTGLEDRQSLSQDIGVAHAAGARLHLACEIVGIDLRTLQRWKAHEGLTAGDGRPQAVRALPSHALSDAERAELVRVANEPRFVAVPPARIVPMLADDGVYLASESSFSRVLRERGQNVHRGRAKAPKASRPPTTHIATATREVLCWDMTYLPAVVMGRRFHLYLILDLYGRKIVGWEVHDTDDSEHAVHLVRRTALAEDIAAMTTKTGERQAACPVAPHPRRRPLPTGSDHPARRHPGAPAPARRARAYPRPHRGLVHPRQPRH